MIKGRFSCRADRCNPAASRQGPGYRVTRKYKVSEQAIYIRKRCFGTLEAADVKRPCQGKFQ